MGTCHKLCPHSIVCFQINYDLRPQDSPPATPPLRILRCRVGTDRPGSCHHSGRNFMSYIAAVARVTYTTHAHMHVHTLQTRTTFRNDQNDDDDGTHFRGASWCARHTTIYMWRVERGPWYQTHFAFIPSICQTYYCCSRRIFRLLNRALLAREIC